jgi:hypothetical protein
MGAGLDVDRERIAARLHEPLEVEIGVRDHQVEVQRQSRALADRLDDGEADRDVGDEVAVHHVHVELVGAPRLDARDLVGEDGVVGGEDGRGDLDRARHERLLRR